MERPVLVVALKRCALTVAALLLLPAAGQSQLMPLQDDPLLGARLRITPTIGWATGIDREETWATTNSAGVAFHDAVIELAGGPVAGLNIEYTLRRPFSLLLGGLYVQRDDAVFSTSGSERLLFTGSKSILAKAGASVQLHERESEMALRRLTASVFAAPFYMLEMPDEIADITGTDLFDSSNHFGINFGLSGELPFAADRLAFQLAFEDYFTFWNDESSARLAHYFANDPTDPSAVSTADVDATHQWVIRAGLSFRIR